MILKSWTPWNTNGPIFMERAFLRLNYFYKDTDLVLNVRWPIPFNSFLSCCPYKAVPGPMRNEIHSYLIDTYPKQLAGCFSQCGMSTHFYFFIVLSLECHRCDPLFSRNHTVLYTLFFLNTFRPISAVCDTPFRHTHTGISASTAAVSDPRFFRFQIQTFCAFDWREWTLSSSTFTI